MSRFNKQFQKVQLYTAENSGVKHIKFQDDKPLTVTEMYRRALKGIPLSVPVAKEDRIPLNDHFYVDDFDVLDISIRNDKRITEELRQKKLKENEFRKKELESYKEWKKQQELKKLNKDEKES